MYDLTDADGEPLIHALYPSADAGKVFLLCEKSKSITVLKLLHNIVEIAAQVCPEETLTTYFGPNKCIPLVYNHPRATEDIASYATKLASYVTNSNPQDAPETQASQTNRNAKRTRDGEHRQQPGSYAATASGAGTTNPSTSYGADVDGLLATLNSNLTNLQALEGKQKNQEKQMEAFQIQINQMDQGLKGHGRLLTVLSETQTQQGALLTSLDEKADGIVNAIMPDGLPSAQNDSQLTNQPSSPSNLSHGGPEGMAS